MFHYDFGDNWYFDILVQKVEETEDFTPKKILKRFGLLDQDTWGCVRGNEQKPST